MCTPPIDPNISPPTQNLGQSLTPEGFADISPWSENVALDAELKNLAHAFYTATLGQAFTDEDTAYHIPKALSVRASQMLQVYQSEPDAPDLSFAIVFEFLKTRFNEHLHNLIWEESKFFDMPYNFTPNNQLVETILKDEMHTLWFDGAMEQILNDDYRRCVDLWRDGERTYFAPADVQKWVGVFRSVDWSDGLNNHPVKTVAIGAFAAYTAPISWTYALLWTGGGLVNAGIQYETAEIDLATANSPDTYEIANRGYGQALGMGAQAVLPVAARYMRTAPAEQPTTTAMTAPRTSTAPIAEPPLATIPAPRQLPGPVEPVAAAPDVVMILDDGTQIVTPRTTTPRPATRFDHPVAAETPVPLNELAPINTPTTTTISPTAADLAVAELLGPQTPPQLPALVSPSAPVATPIRVPTASLFDPIAYAAAQTPVEDVWPTDSTARPSDAFDGMSHPDDVRVGVGVGVPTLYQTSENNDDDNTMQAAGIRDRLKSTAGQLLQGVLQGAKLDLAKKHFAGVNSLELLFTRLGLIHLVAESTNGPERTKLENTLDLMNIELNRRQKTGELTYRDVRFYLNGSGQVAPPLESDWPLVLFLGQSEDFYDALVAAGTSYHLGHEAQGQTYLAKAVASILDLTKVYSQQDYIDLLGNLGPKMTREQAEAVTLRANNDYIAQYGDPGRGFLLMRRIALIALSTHQMEYAKREFNAISGLRDFLPMLSWIDLNLSILAENDADLSQLNVELQKQIVILSRVRRLPQNADLVDLIDSRINALNDVLSGENQIQLPEGECPDVIVENQDAWVVRMLQTHARGMRLEILLALMRGNYMLAAATGDDQ